MTTAHESYVWFKEEHHGIKGVLIFYQPYQLAVRHVGYAMVCPTDCITRNYLVTMPDLAFTGGEILLSKSNQLRVVLWLGLHMSFWCDHTWRHMITWSMVGDNIKPLTASQLKNPRAYYHTFLKQMMEKQREYQSKAQACRKETHGVSC